MISRRGRVTPASNSRQSAAELAETALDALRAEWRAGFNGKSLETDAMPALIHLRLFAHTRQADAALAEINRRLALYRSLPIEGRKTELLAIADELKSLESDFKQADEPVRPVGKLNESVAPGRAPAPRRVAPRGVAPIRQLRTDAPVTALPRVGDSVAKKLANLGVETVGDLLSLNPRTYLDFTKSIDIGSITGFGARDQVTVRGEVVDLREIRGPGQPRVSIRLADETGWVRVTWFNIFIAKQIQIGDRITVSGQLDPGYGPPSFTGPEWEHVEGPGLSTGRLTPVYPLTKGIAQKTMRWLTRSALDATKSTVEEFLPPGVFAAHSLLPLVDAHEQVHFPERSSRLDDARRRLTFDSLFLLQLGMVRRRRERKTSTGISMPSDASALGLFRDSLPFALTGAQDRVLAEVLVDLADERPMARLVQGDVGSGKTVVAVAAALTAVQNGYQVAVMAPTEILAEQHARSFRALFANLPEEMRPTVGLLTGSTRAVERRTILRAVESGGLNILAGTHALIQPSVRFADLGFVVIDEQHRFGVRQRGQLPAKANSAQPHVLAMTATPIPRTLNMVLHGDLDVSTIDEMPPGRIPIETTRHFGDERMRAYDLVRNEVRGGRQVFVICPLVEESETSDAKAAVAEAERLQRDVFPSFRIATLHGRMNARDKDRIMTEFRNHESDILVSTSVIEVGIDIPNATVMLIEGADRFGLAQLHQFRGRVGRGGNRSYCLLLADEVSAAGETRLTFMENINDGFVLAEKDLELRGPGDFVGTRQSGLPEMSWLDSGFDTRLLEQARHSAETLLDRDPELTMLEHAPLRARLLRFWEAGAPAPPVG